jgi:5-oxoprolinase (ATP-hydrolysing) subunit A
MKQIDINCDMGESFGAYKLGDDEAILAAVSSANIACGFHAGDPLVMDTTVRLAMKYGVAIGAHPGYPDLQGFGRRNMDLTPEEVEGMVLYQLGALAGFVTSYGGQLVHVKPHGALYNQAAKDRKLALGISRAVQRFSKELILVGLAGSVLVEVGKELGLRVAAEAFPDRAYEADGSLRSRRLPGAVLESPQEVLAHALSLAREGISLPSGSINIDTLCVHGDNPAAVTIAHTLRHELLAAGITIAPLAR